MRTNSSRHSDENLNFKKSKNIHMKHSRLIINIQESDYRLIEENCFIVKCPPCVIACV
jgi:hypothetical protein